MLLLGLMFLVKWYGTVGLAGRLPSQAGPMGAQSAWHVLTILRWLILLTVAVALLSPLLHAIHRSHGTQTASSWAVSVLGTITAALLVYRVLIGLPAPDEVVDQKAGAVLGLLAAVGIALGGYQATREEERSGGERRLT